MIMSKPKYPIRMVLIIDFVTTYYVNMVRMVEVSYKIVNLLHNNTRIVSFIYRPLVSDRIPRCIDEVYEPASGYMELDNGEFFRQFNTIITRGHSNKEFIKQFCDARTNVIDIIDDVLPLSDFAADVHPRWTRLTQQKIFEWQDPSMCPRSRCRNVHENGCRESCSFKNVKCIIDWLNAPVF